jgi:hypothetical protein
MHGQGSVITGLSEDSDLDLILVWERDVPSTSTLPGATVTSHGELLLEQARLDGYDVDLMHIPRLTFEGWLRELEQGEGWSDTAWPSPIYVAAGLAEGKLLLDPTGHGAAERSRVQVPPAALVARVRDQLEAAAPGFVKEMRSAADKDHHWLHASLAVQLHKLIYTTWFLVEGHYPPFPKYLPQWYERFDMNSHVRSLEVAYWTASDQTTALEALAAAVLDLPLPDRSRH